MTMVRISTKYPINEEDAKLLPPNKTFWWMRNSTTGTFVKEFPRIPCTQAFDLSLDLPDDNEFVIGCGDYNVVNEAGNHISQKIYGYVKDGQFRYCKRTELPSMTGGMQTTSAPANTGYNPFGVSAPAPQQAPKPEMIEIKDSLYCLDSQKFVTPEYNCITGYCPREDTGLEDCSTCMNSRTIFYSN